MMPAKPIPAPLLSKALSRGIEPAYYLHGSSLLRDEALALLIDTLLDPALKDFNLDLLSARTLGPERLAETQAALPMMAERRLVVIRDVEAWHRKSKAKQAGVKALQQATGGTVVVLVQGDEGEVDKELAAVTTLVDCSSPSGQALEAWLDHRLELAGVSLRPDAREHLLRATGGDAGFLAAEIAKLSGLDSSEPLNRELVGDLVGVRFGETVDDWRDAVLRDQLAAAARLTPLLLELPGNSGVRLVTTLGSSLLVLRWARARALKRKLRGNALAREVQQFLFRARPAVGSYQPFSQLIAEVVGAWPDTRLRGALAATLEADVALKNTTISDPAGILIDLEIALAATRPAAAA